MREPVNWDKKLKPPPEVCPGRFCFQYVPAGGSADMSGGGYDSFAEAVKVRDDWVVFPEGGCGCGFGLCSRLDPIRSQTDYYEPDEWALQQAGLPWFYFISSVENLIPEFHENYLLESRELWGDDRGSNLLQRAEEIESGRAVGRLADEVFERLRRRHP